MVESEHIGERAEWPRYESAVRNGDELLLLYCLQHGSQRCTSKWSAIDLTSVKWGTLSRSGQNWSQESLKLLIEDAPRPEISSGSQEIPIVEVTAATDDLHDVARGPAEYLLSTSAEHGLSVYHVNARRLVLVARDQEEPGKAAFAEGESPVRLYLTWWAVPARAPLYALTVPIDLVALPVEILIVWRFAEGMRE